MINDPEFNNADFALLQEPHIDHLGMSRANSRWTVVYPAGHAKDPDATRSIILVGTHISTNNWEELPTDSSDITAVCARTSLGPIAIFNIYNDCTHSRNLDTLNRKMTELCACALDNDPIQHTIWAGDFNRHHPLWDEPRNKHLFTGENLDAAQLLIDLLADYGLQMALPPFIPTLRACNTKNLTHPDNIFVSDTILDSLLYCNAEPDAQPPCTDHFPIKLTISLSIPDTARTARHNWKDVDWDEFTDTLEAQLDAIPKPAELRTHAEFDTALNHLQEAIHNTMDKHVKLTKPSPFMKRWWSRDLTKARKAVRKLGRDSYSHSANRNHPAHEAYRQARNKYTELIRTTKQQHWLDWLENATPHNIWDANKFVSADARDGGRARIPTLQVKDEQGRPLAANSNELKAKYLFDTFFPPAPTASLIPDTAYPRPLFDFNDITNDQVARAIGKLKPLKTPRPLDPANAVFTHGKDLLTPFLGPIFRATFRLHIYPADWKSFTIIVLKKPGKTDYTKPNAFRPIALLGTIAKILSSCIAEDLSHAIERLQLLPSTQFGCRPGRTTTDSLHLMIAFIKDHWRKGNVVTGLFLDVKAAFPSIDPGRLFHNMRCRGVPKEYTDWLAIKLADCSTTVVFDDYVSPAMRIANGIDQGCPLSGILFAFYNSPLLDTARSDNHELALGFVDDTGFFAAGTTFEETHRIIEDMINRSDGAAQWALAHNSHFEHAKDALIGFTRRRVPTPGGPSKSTRVARPSLKIGDLTVTPTNHHRFLGILVDEELRFKEHSATALAKGTQAVAQVRRLCKPTSGIAPGLTRQLYLTVVVSKMLYAADVWIPPVRKSDEDDLIGKPQAGFTTKLARVQRSAALLITGAMPSTPNDSLDVHADLLPIDLLINKITARAALRLVTLPPQHPLAPRVRKAARYPRHHRSPLHELLHTFQLSPDTFEKIQPVRLSPKWQSDITTSIAASKKKAIAQVNQGGADAYIYTDGSALDDGGVGASAILYRQGRPNKVLKVHLGDKSKHIVYEGELVGILLAMHLLITIASQISSVLIGVDNQASITTTKTIASGSAHYLADEIHIARRCIKRRNPDLSVGIRWTPGHVGIRGNEDADAEAKKAARGESSPSHLLPPLLRKPLPDNQSATRQHILARIKNRHAERLKLSPCYAKLSRLDPKTPSKGYMKLVRNLSKRDSAILMYLRTGHAPLNKHLFRIGKADSPRCPHCPHSDETIFHFLIECPAYNDIRRQFWQRIPIRSRTITNLLANPKMTKAVLDFVYHTERLFAPRAPPHEDPG